MSVQPFSDTDRGAGIAPLAATRPAPVLLWCAALIAVTALSVWARQAYWLDYQPGADEKDYRAAVRESFPSIYLGANTTPLWTILTRYRSDAEFRAHPWAALMTEGDQLALRHFHTPLAFYPSALLGSHLRSNRAHRAFPIFISAACAPLVVLGGYWLGLSLAASLIGALLIAVDGRFIKASMILTPHPLYVFLSLVALFAVAKLLEQPSRPRRMAVFALFGLALACLELSPLLLVGAAGGTLLSGRRLTTLVGEGHERWWSVASLLLALLLAWPAGVWGLGYATSYGVFAALALFHRGEYYGDATLGTLYERLFGDNALLAFAAAVAVGAAIWACRRQRTPLLPLVASYGLLAVGFNWMNRFRNATYASEATVFLWLVLAAVIDDLLRRGRTERVVAIGLVATAAAAVALELRTVL